MELWKTCSAILKLLDEKLITGSNGESKALYLNMKADYHRYLAEFTTGADKASAAEQARSAYQQATNIATKELPAAHPDRLGLALNFSVFLNAVATDRVAACKIASTALDDSIAEPAALTEDSCVDSVHSMELLRDYLACGPVALSRPRQQWWSPSLRHAQTDRILRRSLLLFPPFLCSRSGRMALEPLRSHGL